MDRKKDKIAASVQSSKWMLCLILAVLFLGKEDVCAAVYAEAGSSTKEAGTDAALAGSEVGSKDRSEDRSEVGIEVGRQTREILQHVDYDTDSKIAERLELSYYSSTVVLNKWTEMLRAGNKTATREDALAEVKKETVKLMPYGASFAKVQQNIEAVIERIVENSVIPSEEYADPVSYFTDKILENKEAVLLGLAYLDRLYDFQMGSANLKDILTYTPGYYLGIQVDPLDWLIQIGNAGGDVLKFSNNAGVFGKNKLFSMVTDASTLPAFLEENRQRFQPQTTMAEWFRKEARALVMETPSLENKAAVTSLYEKLCSEAALTAHILPLLTVQENSVYAIANSATITYGIADCYVDRTLQDTDPVRYAKKIEEWKRSMERAAVGQQQFLDVWYRIAKPEARKNLQTNRLVLDSLRIETGQTISASAEWSPKVGDGVSAGVRDFIAPLDLYAPYMFSDGVAEGGRIRMYVAKALQERGLTTYTHELTHILVSSVWMAQEVRDGVEGEVYTRGMFETYETNDPPVFNLNLVFDRRETENRYCNASPARFQTADDLQTYLRGMFDVIYTLDYAEAQAVLGGAAAQKQKWFHKLEQVTDTAKRSRQGEAGSCHKLDEIRELTLEEAENLQTLDDLIDGQILAARYEVDGLKTTGLMKCNGYYTVPLFTANFAAVQNSEGVSGDIMIRRNAFELLGEYGYYEGLVPYLSNQYKEAAQKEGKLLSDTYILQKIFGTTYRNLSDFKKAMFARRMHNAAYLKPVTIMWQGRNVVLETYEQLAQMMAEAAAKDLEQVTLTSGGFPNIRAQNTQTERLKSVVFQAYLQQTHDFRESVYQDSPDVIKPPVSGGGNTAEPDPDKETPDKEAPDKEASDKETSDKGTLDKETPGEDTRFYRAGEKVRDAAGNFAYRILHTGKRTVSVVRGLKPQKKKVKIPPSVKLGGKSYKVIKIEANAMRGYRKLKKLTLGRQITEIGKRAFADCKKLKCVVVQGTKIKKIRRGAFRNTGKKMKVKTPKKWSNGKRKKLLKKMKQAGMTQKIKVK